MTTPTQHTKDFDHVSIIASDLDGTLLHPDHTISDYSKSVLQKLHAKGKTFVFATGRHYVDVAGFRRGLDMPAFMVTSNGARVHTMDNELIFKQNVDASLVTPVVELIKQDPKVKIHIYQDDIWFTDREDEFMKNYHKDSEFSYTLFDVNNPPTENVSKLFFSYTDHDYLVQYEQKLNDAFGDRLNIAFSSPWCLEVMDMGVSKGHALDVVAKRLGKTLEHCIAFGDGMNDFEMLQMVGKGLVMGTSHEKVKLALPDHEVIGCSSDDAVANYLSDHLL